MPRKQYVAVGHQPRQINAGTVVPFRVIMGKALFRQGFEDARGGKPFREYRRTDEAWTYERGRLFAYVWDSPEFKRGRAVYPSAVEAFGDACRRGEIF